MSIDAGCCDRAVLLEWILGRKELHGMCCLNCLLSVCITSIEPGQSYLRTVLKTIYLKLYFSQFFSAGFPLGRFLGFEFALRTADIYFFFLTKVFILR